MKKTRSDRTLVNHPIPSRLEPWNVSPVSPIYQTAKFGIDSMKNFLARSDAAEDLWSEPYLYTRVSNPTNRELERTLAELQGRDEALVYASGMGAMMGALLGLLRAGDEVFYFRESYKPVRDACRMFLSRFGVLSRSFSLSRLEELEAYLAARAQDPGRNAGRGLLVFEALTNPVVRVADTRKLMTLARQYSITTLLDGTFTGLHQLKDLEVDGVIQSLTKYAAGHGDVTGGAVIGSQSLISEIRGATIMLGGTLDPHAAFLIQRGLKTYPLRYSAQSRSALEVARFLAQHPKVARVFYPGLESDPQHALAASQLEELGGVLALELKSGAADAFVGRLKLFAYTVSLGATDSLATPVKQLYASDLTPDEQRESFISDGTIRLSIGLEEAQDLVADLAAALALEP